MSADDATGMIVIAGPTAAWTDRLRDYLVLIDGQELDRVGNGETKSFRVAAGAHEVQLRIDGRAALPFRSRSPPGPLCRLR